MSSEWLKVMLEEIARKKSERVRLRAELEGEDAPPAGAAVPVTAAPSGDGEPVPVAAAAAAALSGDGEPAPGAALPDAGRE